jgi:hypothetical protein
MRGRCERMICCGYLETSTPIWDPNGKVLIHPTWFRDVGLYATVSYAVSLPRDPLHKAVRCPSIDVFGQTHAQAWAKTLDTALVNNIT